MDFGRVDLTLAHLDHLVLWCFIWFDSDLIGIVHISTSRSSGKWPVISFTACRVIARLQVVPCLAFCFFRSHIPLHLFILTPHTLPRLRKGWPYSRTFRSFCFMVFHLVWFRPYRHHMHISSSFSSRLLATPCQHQDRVRTESHQSFHNIHHVSSSAACSPCWLWQNFIISEIHRYSETWYVFNCHCLFGLIGKTIEFSFSN